MLEDFKEDILSVYSESIESQVGEFTLVNCKFYFDEGSEVEVEVVVEAENHQYFSLLILSNGDISVKKI